jgi:hypothetical protein
MFALLATALALAPAPTVRLPELGQLTRAVRSGDDVEIERVAARFGPVRLERIAERGKREERLAALRGLSVVDDAWYMLPDLVRLLADGDADIAEAAALAVRRIAGGLSPAAMFAEEVPRDVPARAAAGLFDTAKRSELRPSVRVAAIGAIANLRTVAKVDDSAMMRLLADPEPQVRRASADALGSVASAENALVSLIADDPALDVAAAAAAALCRDVPPTGMKGTERAARLTPKARDRLRALAADEQLPLVDRLDLLGCVRVNAQPPDQKLLDQLAKSKVDSVKRRARSLGGK